ncbi:cation:proton antiporter [Streptomyces sp. JJ36]|uniref:cation:proton antiporter domain-containing protein n=1 Tax=Streptomyces sp. JJ36 TaxID=2736645 RepID=UPI001F004CDE|nr:cation:proton antiporter [Streptomyces sp. JJ36]MCF6525397.1 cation:proton antiporter [Streptomyces sp. JJ36]
MTDVLVFAGLLLAFGLVSGRVRGTSLTAPMVFVSAGLLLGPAAAGVLTGTVDEEAVRILAEVTLVLVLFTDAVRIDLGALRREYAFPLRLLALGMPLGILLGTAAGVLVLDDLGVWEVALLAAVLAPTDAALGAAVVSDRRLPVRVRQTLNVESGLNDGIALPVVTLLVALAAGSSGDVGSAGSWAGFAARQIGLGALVGVLVGGAGGLALRRMDAAGWTTENYRRLAVLALATLAYGLAEVSTGNGFIGAFVAGLCFGSVARPQAPHVHEFAEREGELFAMATFLMFGGIIMGPRLGDIGWQDVLYALLSLTVVRMAAVAVAMAGSGVRRETVLFFGWFGPRGLASLLFALLVVEESDVAHADAVMLVAGVAVTLSVYAHGLTAAPWARGFARRAARLAPAAPEQRPTHEHPVRHRIH